MKATVNLVPPTQPRLDLTVEGLKNFSCNKDGFTAQFTVAELKELWGTITATLTAAGVPVTTEPLP